MIIANSVGINSVTEKVICIKVIALRISIYGFVKSVITIFMKCLIGK